MPGRLPPPPPANPEVDLDADVLGAVAADRVRDQRPASGTRYPWMPNNNGMAPGRSRAEPGPGAQRLRCRRRERLGVPPLDRTLRDPPCPERDEVAERDDRRTDAITSDERGHASLDPSPHLDRAPHLDPNPYLGGASQLADDHTRDLG